MIEAATNRDANGIVQVFSGRAVTKMGTGPQKDEYAQYIRANAASLETNVVWDAIDGLFPFNPLEEVAKASPQHYLIIVSALDRMVNPQPSLAWAAAKGAPTYISQGTCAHIIMDCDAAAVSTLVQKFLSEGKAP